MQVLRCNGAGTIAASAELLIALVICVDPSPQTLSSVREHAQLATWRRCIPVLVDLVDKDGTPDPINTYVDASYNGGMITESFLRNRRGMTVRSDGTSKQIHGHYGPDVF